jgi:hypothetical protein
MTASLPEPTTPPLATADQEYLELAAVRLLSHPVVQAAAQQIGEAWIARARPTAEQRARFEGEFEQAALCGVVNALNQDSNYPRIQAFGRFAHHARGVRIPGTKSANPNPDYIYRLIPIDGQARFAVHGLAPERRPIAFEFSVLDKGQVYLGNVSAPDLVIGPDRRFTITVGPDAPGGRPNHIQTTPSAVQILIRDVLADVAYERPYALTVERLDPPTAPPLPEEAIVPLCGPAIAAFVDDIARINSGVMLQRPANQWDKPAIHTGAAFIPTQAYSGARFRLNNDEALVFTLTLGNAAYAVVPVNNLWGGINDYFAHIGTLGTGRAARNPDGSYSFVLSLADPGVHNWVDPDGLHEGLSIVRWIGFDRAKAGGGEPTLDVRLVRLSQLESALPSGAPRIDAAGRRAQLVKHAADYLAAMG